MVDGQWTEQKFERIQFPFLHCHLKVHGFRGKESQSKTLRSSEPLSDVKVAMRSETTRGHRPIQTVAGNELKDVSESLHKGQKGWIEEMK